MSEFINLFSEQRRFYYGLDMRDKSSWHITNLANRYGLKVSKKPIQWVKNYFDTFALFSGDSDFSMLLRFLRSKGKKIILFYAGRISYSIENYADLLVNAQKIKRTPYKGVRKSDPHPRTG